MHVLYFSRSYTTHDWRFVDRLGRSGHDVWYLRLERDRVPLEGRPLPGRVRAVEWRVDRGHQRGLLRQLAVLPSVRKVLRVMRPDLVHAGPVYSCGFLAALAGARPLIVMSWGSDVLVDADRGPLWRWVTRFTLRHADMIVGDSQAVREKVSALSGLPDDRIVTFPWGIDLEMFRPRPSRLELRERLGWQESPVILSTRSWEPLYGTDVLLKAFAATAKRVRNARLLLLGDGTLAPKVRAFIEKNDLSQFVHLAGQVPHDQLADYFNLADVYVSTAYSDGTSISLLEAMACGLPVIVTDVPGNREWVMQGTNGWLVKPGDASSLTTVLVRALGEATRWPRMGQVNRSLAEERADWNRNFQVLLDAYERLNGVRGREGARR